MDKKSIPIELQSFMWDPYDMENAEIHNERILEAYELGLKKGQEKQEHPMEKYWRARWGTRETEG